ncbi:MAG: hypothetical protein IJS81_07375, partial [Selenomonadaceae bacterium]|nr:hypothetical protein [Selenomonadaceae bacterium]
YKKTYMLESLIWKDLKNFSKEAAVLKFLLGKFDISSPDEKDYVVHILKRLCKISSEVCLNDIFVKSAYLMSKLTEYKSQNTAYISLSDAMLIANAIENFSAEDFRALYDEYKKYFAEIKPYPKKFYNHEKIRVGFMSADFKNHTVMTWSWALLTKLDKNFFRIYCYSNVDTPNKVTNYLSSMVDGWRDIHDLTDEEVAKIIRDDEIDILFDLSGHTAGTRLSVAAYRPASVQISGIGYMNSTGLDAIDYFLSDVYCAGNSEKYFTEKLLILPHSHICYEAPTKYEPAANPPCLKNNFVTFGSFNRFIKMTDSTLTVWKKIMDSVPDSRLILKQNTYNTVKDKNFVGNRLSSFGFDLSRVEMRPYSSDWLLQYADVDIALDTFPYTGGVTTCEALYMGIPVISLYGDRHGTRFGLSILSNVGLNELAVDSYDEYIKRAVALAGDWELLKILRKNLRIMMKKSPLTDAEGYVREVEKAFAKILSDEREKFSSK